MSDASPISPLASSSPFCHPSVIMDFLDKQILAPKSWEKFEDLVHALFAEVWNDPVAKKHGRRGQPQHGVDVYGEPNGAGGPIHGIQCKGKDASYSAKASVAEFDAELAKAEAFEPPLSHWTFATTAPDDKALQEHARKVSKARRAAGKFAVDVLGWGSLHALIAKHTSVIRQFYPEHAPGADHLDLLAATTAQALAAIDDVLRHGDTSLSLIRSALWREARQTLDSDGIVRLTGEGGSGKSGLVRRLGETFPGRVLAITDNRTTATSLQQHLGQIGIVADPADLFESMIVDEPALLLVDGADRLLLSGRRGIVVDAFRLIAKSKDRRRWRIATTARSYQERDLVADALSEAGFEVTGKAIDIGMPSEDDAAALAVAFPAFAPLLSRDDLADQNRSLFMLRELLKRERPTQRPLTEVDLAASWAVADQGESERTAQRSKALSELGQQLVADPWRRPGRAQFEAVGLQLLIEERSVLSIPNQDAVSLVHDVHEDWLLARALHGARGRLPAILKQAGEPLWWLRAVRLAAQIMLEAGDLDGWGELLSELESECELDPAWARAILVAPLYSEQAAEILPRLETKLLEDDAHTMGRLLETLLVFETRINNDLLSSPDFAEMEETVRYSVAAHFKIPQMRSWATFLRWSLARWETWSPKLVPKLTDLAVLFTRAFRSYPNWLSRRMAEIASRWLSEIEDALNCENWDDRREPFETKLPQHRGWQETRKKLREVLVQAVDSAPQTVEAYLNRLAQLRRLESARRQLLESPGRVPAVLPQAWTDMCLTQFVSPRRRVRYGPEMLVRPDYFSVHEMHDSGIEGDQGFFPSSPLRGGFADLFKADEEQALRLLHRLEMRASVFFRWYMKCHERRRPLPLQLKMPWGDYRLWGDVPVYKWSRGVLGSNVLGSAYLALDNWMHEQAAAGRPLEDLLKLVLQHNGLVATTAPCIATIAEHINDGDSIDFAGPFLAEPRLWDYDIRRQIDDRGFAHRIGFMRRDLHFDATEDLYQRHAARQPLHHALLLPFRLKANAAAQEAFDLRRSTWSAADLAEFEAELDDVGLNAAREERIARCRSDSDPAQIQAERVEGEIHVSIAPPKEAEPEIEAMNAQHRVLEDSSRLANWVTRSRESRAIDEAFSIGDAIAFAEGLVGAFNSAPSEEAGFVRRMTAAAIVGTAAVAANLGSDEIIEGHKDWIEQWLLAGARLRRDPVDDALAVDEAVLVYDVQVLGAWGLAALASRGLAASSLDETVFALAVQRLHAVTEAVIEGLVWSKRPDFARAAHVAALDSCIVEVGHWWRGDEERRKAAARTARLRAQAIKRAMRCNVESLPLLPPPAFSMQWVRTGKAPWSWRRLKMRSKRALDWNKAASILKRVDWSKFADSPHRQNGYSGYLAALVDWTRAYSEEDARRYDSHFPYEWGHALAREIGRFAASNGRDNEWEPLASFTYHDRAEDLVGNYLDAVAHELMVSGRAPDGRFWSAWKHAAEWVMDRTVPKKRDGYDNISQALRAAGLVGPYFTPIPPDWPHLEQVLPWIDGWVEKTAHLPSAVYSVLSIGERMSPEQRLRWFVPWVGKWTDAGGSEESYWSYYDIGNKAAALLKVVPDGNHQERRKVRQYLGIIADSGSVVARELLPQFATARPLQ